MPIQVVCPKCGSRLNAPDAAAGKRVRCKCGEAISVPTALSGPTSSSSPTPRSNAPPPPNSSLLDVLTDRDLQQAQANPYAPTSKASNTDAAALRTYLRNDDEKKAQAKKSEGNLVLITVCFFIGMMMNGAIAVLMFAVGSLTQQIEAVAPLIRAGAFFFAIMLVFALFDLAVGIGMIARKPWGWWTAIIGLGWGAWERLSSLIVGGLEAEEYTHLIGVAIGALVFASICLSLINFMIQTETQKKFLVEVKPAVAWLVALLVPLVLQSIVTGILVFAAQELETTLQTMEQTEAASDEPPPTQ
ncbi:MAG: zinc-ribbon domain-containing protein [Pirellula sp.]|nr:zinc-ribbon domain-containing protein [Pirellula sp.]